MKNRVIAIDFGTCNTYLSQSVNGGPAEEFNIAVGGDSAHGMKSVIMYRTKGEHAGNNEFGQEAINAYATSPKKIEANGLELASSFKPDIEVSEKARQDSICFLTNLLTEANKQNLHIDPAETDVFFGVPSEASEDYRARLLEIARKAGWGDVRLLDEPFGALCYYQDESSEDVVNEMLNDSVLVVDFGGGTCDFVILENGDIKYSWGDMLLGGRLFDDLFYQWIIDCSQDSIPVTEEQLIKTNKDFYWRCIKCRELKEKFSNAMVKDNTCPYEEYFADQYELELPWDEFVRRAQNYHPSKSFLNMTKLPADMSKTMFNPDGTTDILNWFEKELRRGFEISRIPISSVDKILLAGGSSTWSFVRDACKKIFGEEKLIRCTNPFAAISMGLVKYCKIKEVAMGKILAMEQDAKTQKAKFVQKLMDTPLSDNVSTMLTQKAAEIFEKFAMPALNNFSEKGGMLSDLEQSLSSIFNRNAAEINEILSPVFNSIGSELKYSVISDIKSWFWTNGINPDELNLDNIVINLPEFSPTNADGDTGVASGLGKMIAATIIGAIIGLLLVGTISLGPFAIIIAPILALGGKVAVENWARTTSWTPAWAKWLISGDVIPNLQKKFYADFVQNFADGFAAFKKSNKGNIENAVDSSVNQALALYRKVANMERGTRAGGAESAGFSSSGSAGDAFGR